jgi:ADP-ribose pyrophosphatase YjhB (NUDIX family)
LKKKRRSVMRKIAAWARTLLIESDEEWWQSAGGLVFNARGEVALIRQGRRWTFPKGRLDRGEGLTTAARREVREETGLATRIVAYIDVVEATRHETHYFLMLLESDTGDHDDEVDEVTFVVPAKAQRLLHANNDKRLLTAALRLLKRRR